MTEDLKRTWEETELFEGEELDGFVQEAEDDLFTIVHGEDGDTERHLILFRRNAETTVLRKSMFTARLVDSDFEPRVSLEFFW